LKRCGKNTVSNRIAKEIDVLYKKYQGEVLQTEMQKVLERKTVIKINLERNSEKAELLKKRIGKDFALFN